MARLKEFLQESNAIEGVYDDDSLLQARKAWQFLRKKDSLSMSTILEAHAILMKNQNIPDNLKGFFRRENVRVGSWYAPHYGEVPGLIWHWCFETIRSEPPVDPIKLHIDFEKIHPFIDGNGRIGRLLLNWTRVKRNKQPILVIKESEKEEYYKWFQ